jgi:hypothetical protein
MWDCRCYQNDTDFKGLNMPLAGVFIAYIAIKYIAIYVFLGQACIAVSAIFSNLLRNLAFLLGAFYDPVNQQGSIFLRELFMRFDATKQVLFVQFFSKRHFSCRLPLILGIVFG